MKKLTMICYVEDKTNYYCCIYHHSLTSKFKLYLIISSLCSIYFYFFPGHNGTINGQGKVWWIKHFQKTLNYTRGPLVQIMWSRDIVISNITLRDSPFWTLHPYDCKNVTISNVTILAPIFKAPNTDGIDPGLYKLYPMFNTSSITLDCLNTQESYKSIQD